MPRSAAVLIVLMLTLANSRMLVGQAPAVPNKVETPTVTVLTGLTVPQFEQEMQHFVQATGGTCNSCQMPKGNFASDENPRKVKAREMIGMTKALNKQYFPDHKPAEAESTLGRVSCYTCHQGDLKPKSAP
jgi:Photosynthetic reaction centre cytochrome C subunit